MEERKMGRGERRMEEGESIDGRRMKEGWKKDEKE